MSRNSYSGYAKADDCLQSSRLTLTLPAAALSLSGINELLSITPSQIDKAIKDARVPRGQKGGPVASITLATADWDWDEESIDTYDEDGQKDSIDVKLALILDESRDRQIEHLQYKMGSALAALGIPHDLEKQHGIPSYSEANPPKIDKFRINPDSPSDYCVESSDREKPGFDEIAYLAKKCKNIEKLNEWLADFENTAKPLTEEALAFEELLAKPGYKDFLEASAGIFSLCYRLGPIYGGDIDPKWDARIPLWSKTIWNNENPIDRMSRISVKVFAGLKFRLSPIFCRKARVRVSNAGAKSGNPKFRNADGPKSCCPSLGAVFFVNNPIDQARKPADAAQRIFGQMPNSGNQSRPHSFGQNKNQCAKSGMSVGDQIDSRYLEGEQNGSGHDERAGCGRWRGVLKRMFQTPNQRKLGKGCHG